MPKPLVRVGRLAALALVPLLVLSACTNSSGGTTSSGETDGVTANEIQIGGLAAVTGPLGSQYAPIFDAVQAYLDQVNNAGGVNGRRIVYTQKLDDETVPSIDVQQARALVTQDHVFAVVGVATPEFAGGTYLGQNNIPTFGWNVNVEWAGPPSLFGENGSYLDFTDPGPSIPWLAQHIGADKVGILAYTVAASAQCAQGQENVYKKYGLHVALKDTSLPFGVTDISGDIQRLKNSGAQFVSTCMDSTGNTLLAKSLREANLYNQVKEYWPDGCDTATINTFAPQIQGVYCDTAGLTPYLKGYTQGMDNYIDAMNAHNLPIGQATSAGWINANLFVQGLRMIGHDVTRTRLIDALNTLTGYTANGITPGVNWKYQHTANNPNLNCDSWLQIQGTKLVPVFGTATNPFICWHGNDPPNTNPIPFPGASTFFNSTQRAQ